MFLPVYQGRIKEEQEFSQARAPAISYDSIVSESGLLIEVAIFFPSNVAFLSSLWTKLAEIWYTFNLT